MSTSFLGSSPVSILRQALRAAVTSGRSCSAACRVLKVNSRRRRNRKIAVWLTATLLLCGLRLKLRQCDVRSSCNPLRDPLLMSLTDIIERQIELVFVVFWIAEYSVPRSVRTR